VRFFRAAAESGSDGPLPAEACALLLWRIGRPGDALRVLLARPAGEPPHGESLPPGTLPSVVDLAAAAGDFSPLRDICRERGDEITFAATLVAEAQRGHDHAHRGAQSPQGPVQ